MINLEICLLKAIKYFKKANINNRRSVRDNVHIHLPTRIGQRQIVGTRVRPKSDKTWQK